MRTNTEEAIQKSHDEITIFLGSISDQLGPWTPLAESPHCCERTLNGKRVALIEKTPRVLNPKTGEWESGTKGSGGTDSEKNQVNGYYPPSREWADKRLAELYGYNTQSSPATVGGPEGNQ